jgi:hypothetical protein
MDRKGTIEAVDGVTYLTSNLDGDGGDYWAVVDAPPSSLCDVTSPRLTVGRTVYQTGIAVDHRGYGFGYAWPIGA